MPTNPSLELLLLRQVLIISNARTVLKERALGPNGPRIEVKSVREIAVDISDGKTTAVTTINRLASRGFTNFRDFV